MAAVVTILTLSFNPGPWGYVSTLFGAVLLCVLVAFFARHPADAAVAAKAGRFSIARKTESFIAAIALAALVGIGGAVTAAWPVQSSFFKDNPYCSAVGVNAAVSAVQPLSETGLNVAGITATGAELRSLVRDQLTSTVPVDDGTALGMAFSDKYQAASGDCMAGDTEDHLWWIALPLFVITLVCWAAAYRHEYARVSSR